MAARSMPADVKLLSWAARQLFIADSTAYRLAPEIPGAFKVGGQWRVSVPKFMHEVHGFDPDKYLAAIVVEPSAVVTTVRDGSIARAAVGTEDLPGCLKSVDDDRGPTASIQKAETGGSER